MKKTILSTILSLALVLGFAAGTFAASEPVEITVTHDLGETTLTTNPERIIVFDYGTLDALDFAGIEVTALGKAGKLPEHLEKYQSDDYPAAGTLHEPDFETVNDLEPDLILISARAASAYEELSKIAPTVYIAMPTAGYLETFEKNIDILSQIFPDQADLFTEQLASIHETAAAVSEKVQENGYTALVIMSNDGEISVFGLGSRFAIVYDDFGFTVSDESIEQSTHGQSATFEYVAEQNPDFLFVIDRSAAVGAEGSTGAAQLLDNELINGTEAAQNGRIVYLNPSNWYVVAGGVNSTTAMAAEIAAAVE